MSLLAAACFTLLVLAPVGPREKAVPPSVSWEEESPRFLLIREPLGQPWSEVDLPEGLESRRTPVIDYEMPCPQGASLECKTPVLLLVLVKARGFVQETRLLTPAPRSLHQAATRHLMKQRWPPAGKDSADRLVVASVSFSVRRKAPP